MDFVNMVPIFESLLQWLGNKDDGALKASQDVGQTNRIIIKATQKANSFVDFRRKGGGMGVWLDKSATWAVVTFETHITGDVRELWVDVALCDEADEQ